MNIQKAEMIANDAMNLKRKMGIELELSCEHDSSPFNTLHERLNDRGINTTINLRSHYGSNPNGWHIKRDGTPSNPPIFEIVSPPLCAIEMFNQLKVVIDIINEMKLGGTPFSVHKKCGLHIHHHAPKFTKSRGGRNYKRFKYLMNHFVKNEHNFDSMVAKSRRKSENGYCETNECNLDRNIDVLIDYDCERYRKLNLHSYSKHKTIEFRGHQGTLNFAKIVYWCAFTQACLERSHREVKRTEGYQSPMINYMLASGWGEHYEGGILPKNDGCQQLIYYICATMQKFEVQQPPIVYNRNEIRAEENNNVITSLQGVFNEDADDLQASFA